MKNGWWMVLAVGCGGAETELFEGGWVIGDATSDCDPRPGFDRGDVMGVVKTGRAAFTVSFLHADDPFDRFHECQWVDAETFVCDEPCTEHECPPTCDYGTRERPCPELSGTTFPGGMTVVLDHPSWEGRGETCSWTADAEAPHATPESPFDGWLSGMMVPD